MEQYRPVGQNCFLNNLALAHTVRNYTGGRPDRMTRPGIIPPEFAAAYALTMTDTAAAPPQAPGPQAGAEGGAPEETETDDRWGRVLDAAGVVAGVVLVVIVFDIVTDGRFVSRWLRRRGGDELADEQPETEPTEQAP